MIVFIVKLLGGWRDAPDGGRGARKHRQALNKQKGKVTARPRGGGLFAAPGPCVTTGRPPSFRGPVTGPVERASYSVAR
ncbi:hypothetical protein GCM10023176_46860 [Micromonospora coerulea]|uniref:Uncharacterized protein n=1 Tax=Micromonospora coerulea TaxID=47856 RepID=A0ABP8SXL1_9ACTN